MSTNDDLASRRGRRPDQGGRGPVRQDRDWDQSSSRDRAAEDPYQDQRGRDSQQQRGGGYSNFNRQGYPNQQEPTLPQPQGYYPDAPQRGDTTRYVDPAASSYMAPPPPYEQDAPNLGFHDSGHDLFVRDAAGPSLGQYPNDVYDQNRSQQPPAGRREAAAAVDDYERQFPARGAPEAQAGRFFLPDEEPKRQRVPQPDRGYQTPPPPSPQYAANTYSQQDDYENHFEDNWQDEHAEDGGDHAHHDLAPEDNEFDEDFFADEDELENEHAPVPKKRNRKRLIVAALAGAMVVGGGGAYVYKSFKGGAEESATPYIRADNRPLKELPGNPGGKQFPNGEKTIYDRLTPDGQQIQAAAYAPPAPMAPAASQPAPGNSLEERIDEALRKAQQSSDAPQQPAPSAARGSDQPTVVRSEIYRPDGTRVDAGRPMVMPTITDAGSGQLPPPFGPGAPQAAAPAAAPMATPFQTVPVLSSQAPQFAAATTTPRSAPPTARSASLIPAEPTATPSGGFWVSLKSAPDEKAIQRDLAVLTDKYKSVLGEVPLTSKIADLGAKGVHYRAVAGPLSSRQEAMELCQKIKGVGGDKACFVTN